MMHTKAPWEWREMGDGSWVLWGAHGTRPIVLAARRKGMNGATFLVRENGLLVKFTPTHPDARLIEAAPVLAAMVKRLADVAFRAHIALPRAAHNDDLNRELRLECDRATEALIVLGIQP